MSCKLIFKITGKEKLIKVKAFGGKYLSNKVADTTVTLLKFRNKVKSHIFVSQLHPYKDQRLVVVGEKGMLVFADVLSKENKLVFYNHKVGWRKNIPLVQKAEGKKILARNFFSSSTRP